MIAASTTWNVVRCGGLVAAAAELRDLGFGAVELRAKDGAPDAATCGEGLRALGVRVVSAHAPLAPGPETGEALDALASADVRAREWAVAALLASAGAAKDAGTALVVVHAGEVPVPGARDRLRRWRGMVGLDGVVPAGVREEAAALRAERAPLRDAALAALVRALHAACRAEPEVTFALETRLHLHEIPALDEVEILFSEVGSKRLAYWHDTGHAAVQEALGGPPAGAWLARHGPRCAGVHLHDVAGLADHLPPGAGTIPWREVAAALPSRCVRTLEVNRRWPAEMLLEGRRVLEAAGIR